MYSLILLNGGVGARLGADSPKQFLKVHGMPVLVYSLVAANEVPEIDQVVLNYPSGWLDEVKAIVRDYAITTTVTYVEAGSSRHNSVARMVDACTNDRVLVHESARPMVTVADFAELIAAPYDNCSFMSPISFTVAPVDPVTKRVTGYLERDGLRNVQLPQKFLRADLKASHDFAVERAAEYTEDATLVAAAGHDVYFIDGDESNLKVTGPVDVQIANVLLRSRQDADE
ncbi:2-C-methyl-D-erythritol 4-phosphate cytidylyltransferase [Salinibacterium sp. UTAS2018]|uniref:IspD/TarI family cytidylyltransferase n=1 Tax=Salinibacterium sp. UTAS2018 TaxID=2508880 RepID=UPI001009853A|nr:2-C-methyl-D-erythritol 4-phosphate cytidylyltransferase [Salinibacterium sp. UTAS2018]QAV69989.1 2-C-methyl-D-erythritol 4-phosphate cytidylyltransferase [Salinibacterium sp. UTAS2018]